MTSGRVHSRYARRLADVAIGGRRVMIRLSVRRFLCASLGCARTTFAEQVDGPTSWYARRTARLAATLGAAARWPDGPGRGLRGHPRRACCLLVWQRSCR
jgi:hypothetical protein